MFDGVEVVKFDRFVQFVSQQTVTLAFQSRILTGLEGSQGGQFKRARTKFFAAIKTCFGGENDTAFEQMRFNWIIKAIGNHRGRAQFD